MLDRIEAAIQLEDNSWVALQQPARIVEARSPESVVETQVNYIFRMEWSFMGDPRNLFWDLVAAQAGRHSAFIHTGTHSICSASPELFFSRKGTALAARPMKGTARRGRTLDEDRRQAEELRSSAKQRADNVMIVDNVYDWARSAGHDETALWNRHGEITEAATANIVVERDGGANVTPPVACGLLTGTFRAELLARGTISEAVVTIEELRSASRIWLIHSVHEWRPVVMS